MKKRIILSIGVVAVVTSLYLTQSIKSNDDAMSKENATGNAKKEQLINSIAGTENDSYVEGDSSKATNQTELNSDEYNYLETQAEISELQKELIKLGYLVLPDHVAAYESYTEEALLELAEAGDIVAIQALKNRYSEDEDWEAFRTMQEEAVLHGSVSDIADLHNIEFAKYSGQESRDHLIKSAAYAELAALRGSKVSVYSAITNFNQEGIEFSSDELAKVNQMAKEMLKQINMQRREKGKEPLEQIDDSKFINQIPNTSYSGWGSEYVASGDE